MIGAEEAAAGAPTSWKQYIPGTLHGTEHDALQWVAIRGQRACPVDCRLDGPTTLSVQPAPRGDAARPRVDERPDRTAHATVRPGGARGCPSSDGSLILDTTSDGRPRLRTGDPRDACRVELTRRPASGAVEAPDDSCPSGRGSIVVETTDPRGGTHAILADDLHRRERRRRHEPRRGRRPASPGTWRSARRWARRGVLQGGERLRPTTDATTVQVRDGKVLTADGPFAETKEQIGGFYLVDCKDLDEAIEVAAKIPGARDGSIEVRPIWEM